MDRRAGCTRRSHRTTCGIGGEMEEYIFRVRFMDER